MPLLLFAVLIYWIFGVSLRDRYAIRLHDRRFVSYFILLVELIFVALLVARFPPLRTPIGVVIGLPLLFGLHGLLSMGAVEALKKLGWIKSGGSAKIITVDPKRG